LHPISIARRSSAGCRKDHIWIQCVVRGITCKNDGKAVLLKIKSFLTFQIAHSKAHTPILIKPLSFLAIPFNQLPNMLLILEGGEIAKVIWTSVQIKLV
jgi:hypothetical protein